MAIRDTVSDEVPFLENTYPLMKRVCDGRKERKGNVVQNMIETIEPQ